MLCLKLEESLPVNSGKTCSIHIANNGYKSIKSIVGKVRYDTPIWECGYGGKHKPKGRAGKRMKYNMRFNKGAKKPSQ